MTATPLRPTTSRRAALLADPLLRRDLLLIALVWDHLLDTKPGETIRTKEVAQMTGLPYREILRQMADDVPRYKPPDTPELCQYVGPRGGRCNRRAARSRALRDADDGTITWVTACYDPTHEAWADRKVALHDDLLGARTPPKPAYNTRSRIAHHFEDRLDFPTWWVMITTERASRYAGTLTMGSHSARLGIRRDDVYDIARDPDRGGSPIIQRPRLRIVS